MVSSFISLSLLAYMATGQVELLLPFLTQSKVYALSFEVWNTTVVFCHRPKNWCCDFCINHSKITNGWPHNSEKEINYIKTLDFRTISHNINAPNLKTEHIYLSQEGTVYIELFMIILKFQIAWNHCVNFNFDLWYLGNAWSNLPFTWMRLLVCLLIFEYCQVYQDWKFDVYLPLALRGQGGSEVDFHFFVVSDRGEC